MSSVGGIRLKIEKLVAGGDGLAFHEGKAVFVPFALPGETVRATLSRSRKDYDRAELLEILEASPHRVTPPCRIYEKCGGCNLQHLSYARQVEEKSAIVEESLRRVARIEGGGISTVPSLPFAYRNRVQLHFTPEGHLGFMRRSSSTVVEAPTCPIAVRTLQAWIEERAGGGKALEELRPHIVGKDRFIAFGAGENVWVEGRDAVVETPVCGEPIRFHVKGFFQSNLHLLDSFVPDALAGLQGELAADLYCGVGIFARFLARGFRRVDCVEHNPFTLDLAKQNLPGIGHGFSAETVEDWVQSAAARKRFDCVLVDPPRTGLTAPVRQWIIAGRFPTLVYVSCDPVTMARDLGELVRGGYRLEAVKAFDFYPQTSHVECHARLVQG